MDSLPALRGMDVAVARDSPQSHPKIRAGTGNS